MLHSSEQMSFLEKKLAVETIIMSLLDRPSLLDLVPLFRNRLLPIYGDSSTQVNIQLFVPIWKAGSFPLPWIISIELSSMFIYSIFPSNMIHDKYSKVAEWTCHYWISGIWSWISGHIKSRQPFQQLTLALVLLFMNLDTQETSLIPR